MDRRSAFAFLTAMLIGAVLPAAARGRGRVRIGGRGLPAGARYAGPTLSRPELKSCVQQERSINALFAALDKEEQELEAAQVRVDSYSQRSVDKFNAMVSRFNESGNRANAQVSAFNGACAERAYYDSDMRAVESELAAGR